MRVRINSCGISDCSPQWSWKTHQNGFFDYDLWAVFRGNGQLSFCKDVQKTFYVKSGKCLLLTPNIQYLASHERDKNLLVINVHFDFLDENGEKIYPYILPQEKSISSVFFFRTLLIRTVSLFNSNQANCAEVFLAAALEEFFSCEHTEIISKKAEFSEIVYKMCEEIDTLKNAPTLFEYSKKYGYSERYLGKAFKTLTGVGFSEYVTNSKISKAKTLLLQTTLTIFEIANEVGFYDACHFSRTFSKKVGISPLKYRNQK